MGPKIQDPNWVLKFRTQNFSGEVYLILVRETLFLGKFLELMFGWGGERKNSSKEANSHGYFFCVTGMLWNLSMRLLGSQGNLGVKNFHGQIIIFTGRQSRFLSWAFFLFLQRTFEKVLPEKKIQVTGRRVTRNTI